MHIIPMNCFNSTVLYDEMCLKDRGRQININHIVFSFKLAFKIAFGFFKCTLVLFGISHLCLPSLRNQICQSITNLHQKHGVCWFMLEKKKGGWGLTFGFTVIPQYKPYFLISEFVSFVCINCIEISVNYLNSEQSQLIYCFVQII